MKFLINLFNLAYKYRKEERRYNNYGLGGRIFILIILLVFSGLTIAGELWTFSLLKENVILGILVLILFVAVALSTMENLSMYSVVAFKRAIKVKRMEKLNKKFKDMVENRELKEDSIENTSENQDLKESSTETNFEEEKINEQDTQFVEDKNKEATLKYRKFDIALGFIFGFLALALFVTTIFLFFNFLKNL